MGFVGWIGGVWDGEFCVRGGWCGGCCFEVGFELFDIMVGVFVRVLFDCGVGRRIFRIDISIIRVWWCGCVYKDWYCEVVRVGVC